MSRLGCYVLPGAAQDPRRGLGEARAAEEMGLDAVWIGERYDSKDLAALAGAIGQVTGRVRIGAAVTHPLLRHPMVLASMGQTLQSLTGERFTLGFGRSAMWRWNAYGVPAPTLRSLADTADVLRRLWAGETVAYRGPLGDFPRLRLPVVLDLAPPPLLLAAAGPKTIALAGRHFDGVILHPVLTPDAVRRSAKILREAAEQAGRDPGTVRCIATVLTAPGVTTEEAELAIHARAAGYLSVEGLGDAIVRANGWSEKDLAAYRAQPVLTALDGLPADKHLTRQQLIGLCAGMPDAWLPSSSAAGTVGQAARDLDRFFEAGADEVILHGVVGARLGPLVRHRATAPERS
ncbi:TIGR03857 family LLM class F420-dependent oxidoreductase [Amycolatopsis sp.]|uniref:TIGR03857 family LLM class F420-dependent oxidoreductase n=1 Tax=Amycolatopsis sp. TaxID=37632 RepID=UPI002D03D219|nr:TIGR03857 family LLM class F420-dependent oxidoreductase [Amycolatopsis sp.]HVV08137.1 TIGR03857 family LLM class F420-dependent oxidoreductase [Amycolatopsis sp.]